MTRICHAHCPPESGGVLAAIVVVVIAAAAVIVARIVAGLLPAIFAALATLTVAGSAVAVRLLMRDGLAVRRDYIPAALPVAVPSVVTVTRPRPRVRALPDPPRAIAPHEVLEGTVLDAAAIRQARP
jgi:hypothetical protein